MCDVVCILYRETLKPKGKGPDSLFDEFPADLVAPEPVEPAPTADEKRSGEADATLYTRVEDGLGSKGGKRVRAAIEIEIKPGWHLYHEELGNSDMGAPTKIVMKGAVITLCNTFLAFHDRIRNPHIRIAHGISHRP